jgi:hypothetical protein
MTANENHPASNPDTTTTGPETWVREAIAQQEEYLRRIHPCPATDGDHSWDRYSPAPGHQTYEACWRCRATRTDDDYQRKTTPRPTE